VQSGTLQKDCVPKELGVPRALRSNKFLNTSGQIASSQGIVGPCSAGFPFSQITSAAERFTIELVFSEESP
jgi:hypothetical protein